HPRFDLDLHDVRACPFPSNWFTTSDGDQLTGRRVALPKPDCAERPSECADIDVLNTLDGFNRQARISIPFDGEVDASSAAADPTAPVNGGVFLVRLGDVLIPDDPAAGDVVGVNQAIYDPPTKTLHLESDRILDQHTPYA